MVRGETREMSGVWWWYLLLGILWTLFGMFVLSYRVGSVTAVAAFVGVAFLFGGITLLGLAMLTPGGWRWLNIIVGILALIAGIITFAWPAITLYVVSIFVGLVPDRLRHHPLRQRASWPEVGMVVDELTARDRRVRSRGMGGALMGTFTAHAGDPGRRMGHLPRREPDHRRVYVEGRREAGGARHRLTPVESGRVVARGHALIARW